MTRVKNALLTLAPDFFKPFIYRQVPGMAPRYEFLLRGRPLLFVNYIDALTELNGVDPSRVVVETHDLKFLNYAKQKSLPVTHLRVVGKFRNEMAALNDAEALVAISPNEAALFSAFLSGKSVFYVPSYGTATVLPRERKPEAVYDLIFVGSENRLNVAGITGFLKNCHWVSRYRVALVGRICQVGEVSALAASFANVDLLGYVDDLKPLYAKSKLAISRPSMERV